MDQQRYTELRDKPALVAALLRESLRRQDWSLVAQALTLQEQGVDDIALGKLIYELCRQELEIHFQYSEARIEAEYLSDYRKHGRDIHADNPDPNDIACDLGEPVRCPWEVYMMLEGSSMRTEEWESLFMVLDDSFQDRMEIRISKTHAQGVKRARKRIAEGDTHE